ncbi:hypothetical protein ACSJLP_02320 [Gordonia rhizosphera NBRC 16068]
MEGQPEGTTQTRSRRRPAWWLLTLIVVFGGYLAFRLVQGIVLLIGVVA